LLHVHLNALKYHMKRDDWYTYGKWLDMKLTWLPRWFHTCQMMRKIAGSRINDAAVNMTDNVVTESGRSVSGYWVKVNVIKWRRRVGLWTKLKEAHEGMCRKLRYEFWTWFSPLYSSWYPLYNGMFNTFNSRQRSRHTIFLTDSLHTLFSLGQQKCSYNTSKIFAPLKYPIKPPICVSQTNNSRIGLIGTHNVFSLNRYPSSL